jgi:hypothetical protein
VRVVALIGFLLIGCASKAKLVAQGGDCLQATDCVDGLVCVPQKSGGRICDNDLSGVQATEDATAPAVDAGRRDGSAEGGRGDAGGADADLGADTSTD